MPLLVTIAMLVLVLAALGPAFAEPARGPSQGIVNGWRIIRNPASPT